MDAVEFAAYRLAGGVLLGTLDLTNLGAWARHGYVANQREIGQDSVWAVLETAEWNIRVGQKAPEGGCFIEYLGSNSVAVYEEVLSRAQMRGYEFVHGERKPPDDFFVMDTLASETGVIGILSMMRLLVDSPTSFSITTFLGQTTQH